MYYGPSLWIARELHTSSGCDRDLAGKSVGSSIGENMSGGFQRITAINDGVQLFL